MPTWDRVWPCVLLEVMAEAGRTGNCFLFMWKGKMLSEGIFAILGMNICFPARDPQAIVASMMWSCRCSMTYRAPLRWPFTGSRLCCAFLAVMCVAAFQCVTSVRKLNWVLMFIFFHRIIAPVYFDISRKYAHNRAVHGIYFNCW